MDSTRFPNHGFPNRGDLDLSQHSYLRELDESKTNYYTSHCQKYYSSLYSQTARAIEHARGRKGDFLTHGRNTPWFDLTYSPLSMEEKRECPQYGDFMASMEKLGITVKFPTVDYSKSSLSFDLLTKILKIDSSH